MLINSYADDVVGGGGATDPYFANVGLLVHMGSSLVDSSGNALSVAVGGTAPFLDSTHQQVGADCSDFASAAGGSAAGGNLYLPMTPGGPIDLGLGAYTVECWDYQRASAAYIIFGLTYGTDQAILLLPTGGSCPVEVQGATIGTATIPLNQWKHVALVMDATNHATVYVNGIQQFTPAAVSRAAWSAADTWYFGATQYGPAKEGLAQEWRITKGVARYLANFSPPTLPFPNS